MNERLIKLYFEIEKKLLPEKKQQQIKDVKEAIKEKMSENKIMLDVFNKLIDGKSSLNNLIGKGNDFKKELKIVSKSIKDILGDELIRAEKIRDGMIIKKILEQKEE